MSLVASLSHRQGNVTVCARQEVPLTTEGLAVGAHGRADLAPVVPYPVLGRAVTHAQVVVTDVSIFQIFYMLHMLRFYGTHRRCKILVAVARENVGEILDYLCVQLFYLTRFHILAPVVLG